MKKKILILAAVLMAIGLTACGNNEGQATNDDAQTLQTESSQEKESEDGAEEKVDQVVTSEAASNTIYKKISTHLLTVLTISAIT